MSWKKAFKSVYTSRVYECTNFKVRERQNKIKSKSGAKNTGKTPAVGHVREEYKWVASAAGRERLVRERAMTSHARIAADLATICSQHCYRLLGTLTPMSAHTRIGVNYVNVSVKSFRWFGARVKGSPGAVSCDNCPACFVLREHVWRHFRP